MRGRVVMLIGGILLAWGSATAAAQDDTAAAQTPSVQEGAPVVVRGDTLFRLSSTLGPFTPVERATALARRIDSLAEDPLARATDIAVADSGGITDILVQDFVLMSVTDRDAAEGGLDRVALAEQFAERIQTAIRARETAASFRSILIGVGLTLLATLALVLAFRALNYLFPAIYRRLESWRGTRIPSLRIQRLEVLSSARLTDGLIVLAKVLRVAAVLVILYVYIPSVLGFFPWTRPLASRLVDYVIEPLLGIGRGFVNYLPNLFAVAVIVFVVFYVLKFIHLMFVGLEKGAIALPGFYRDWAQPTYKIVRFLVIAFAAVMIFPYLPGSDTPAFRGISVFLGILVSFGSASAIANIVAGVVMTYMRPFQVGDRVKIAQTVGDVIDRTLLITRVRTTKNVDVTIPNALVLSSHIINFNRSALQTGVILHTGVTIGYDVPWRKVHELLVGAADATSGVMKDPEPFVLQTGLDDFYVRYELNVYTDQPNTMTRIYSDLHENIQDKFNEGGVEIMSPHYSALRDGNRTALPDDYLPKSYQSPAFGIRAIGEAVKAPFTQHANAREGP